MGDYSPNSILLDLCDLACSTQVLNTSETKGKKTNKKFTFYEFNSHIIYVYNIPVFSSTINHHLICFSLFPVRFASLSSVPAQGWATSDHIVYHHGSSAQKECLTQIRANQVFFQLISLPLLLPLL